MDERFEERFKGKTSKMDKNGLATLMDRNPVPAAKDPGLGLGPAARGNNSIPARKSHEPDSQAPTRHQPGSEAVMGEKQKAARSAAPLGNTDRKGASVQKPKQGGGTSDGLMEAGARGSRQDSSSQLHGKNPELLSHSTSSNRLQEPNWQQGQNTSPGKIGAQFQQNAFMMMTPYQFQSPAYPPMMMPPMMPVGYPMMQPGYPMQAMPPTAHTYSAGYVPAYWGQQPFDEAQKRYGLTEQGSFKVAFSHEEGRKRAREPPRGTGSGQERLHALHAGGVQDAQQNPQPQARRPRREHGRRLAG